MPVYRKGRGKLRVVVFYRGQRHDWVVEGTREEALRFESAKRLELEAAGPIDVRIAPTFSDFCLLHYRPHAEIRLQRQTWSRQKSMLTNLNDHFGPMKLTAIATSDVDRYIHERRAAAVREREITYSRQGRPVTYRRRGGSINATSINNELRLLKRLQSFARERGIPGAGFQVRMLDEPERRPKVWSDDELRHLVAACEIEAPEILPMVVFLLNTGCRKGEALALRWDAVDLERREVRIWPSAEWRPKSNRPREIPISDALRPWLDGPRRSPEWVFPSRRGIRYAGWPRLQWETACKAAGLSGGPHRLRHTFASHFVARLPDLGLLATILGHSDEAVTRLYAWMLPDRLARARNVVSIEAGMGPAALSARLKWGALGQGSGKV